KRFGLGEIDAPAVTAAFLGLFATGIFDQDAAHGLGRRRDKVPGTVPMGVGLAPHEPEVSLVDQGGRLQGLAGPLGRQPSSRELAQLVVDEGEQVSRGLFVSSAGGVQQASYVGHVGRAYPQPPAAANNYPMGHKE